MSFLRKNWLRTVAIITLFVASGSVPFIIEQQMLPLVQLSSMLTDYYNPLTGDFNIQDMFENLVSINVLASTETQTTLVITTMIYNKPWNFYPMKIPAINLDLFFKAGRPYDREKQILQQFKADPTFADVREPWFDPMTFSWVRVANIIIPQEINIPVGAPAPVNIIVTLYTNGQEENALSQMIGTIIRQQKIPGKRLFAQGEVSFMGMPIPISLEVPEFTMPVSTEDSEGLDDMLSMLFVDLQPETPSFDMFQSIDLRNYDDQNGNYYRDWNDSNSNGIKDANENFTEPLYDNGTLSVSVFLRLSNKLSIGGGTVELTPSPWNLQEGQDLTTGLGLYGDPSYWDTGKVPDPFVTRYTPKPEIANTIWGTADQQIILYIPNKWAVERNMPNWSNRIFGVLGFIHNETLNLDGGGGSVPLLISTDIKACGDARPNSNFSTGQAFKFIAPIALPSLFPLFNYTDMSLGILGNIKLKLGNMPLSLVINTVMEDIGGFLEKDSSEVESSALSSLQDAASNTDNMMGDVGGFFSLNNFIINGLALDVYNKLLQGNMSLDLDFNMPYGFYFPETEEQAKDVLNIAGGPIQLFNDSKPSNWDTLNETFPYNIPDNVFWEDFQSYADNTEWHSSAHWTIYDSPPNSNVSLTTDGGKDGSNGIVYTTDLTENASIRRNFLVSDGISGIYFDVNFSNTDGDFYAILQNATHELLNLHFVNTTGGVQVTCGGNTAYLEKSHWYRVFVTVDREAGTYDVSISGTINETFAPNGVQTSFQIQNVISSSDFENVIAFNEMDINDTFNGDGSANSFTTTRTIREFYYVLNNESFSCDGTTNEFIITNEANTTGELVQVKGVNSTGNTVTYTYTAGSPSAGYEYTFDSSSRKVRTFFNGLSHNLTSDYTIYISHFVEPDRINAPVGGNTVQITDASPSATTTLLIAYHAKDRNVFSYSASPSSNGGYQYRWEPTTRRVHTYYNGVLYAVPSVYEVFIEYSIGDLATGVALTNNIAPTALVFNMNNSAGPITMDNIAFRNAKTVEEAQSKWYEDHLVMNLTIESNSLQTLFSKIFAEIGSYRNGMGIAYHYNSKHLIGAYGTSAVGYYSKLKENLFDTTTGHPLGTWPLGNDTYDINRGLPTAKVQFEITLDDAILDVDEIFPEIGPGFDSLLESLGIDPLLLDYLNQSLADWGVKSGKGSGPGGIGTYSDLLLFDLTTLLSFLYQDGPGNDIFDFMIDKGYLNETYSALNITALFSGLLNLLGFEDLASGATSGSEDSFDIFAMIPELLQATNIDFDELIMDMVNYLRLNLSYNQGIRPFELVDLIFSSSGTGTTDLLSGIDEEAWYLIFEDLKSLLNIINIMDLAQVAINNPLPFADYLNRSLMMSESVLLPLLTGLLAEDPEGEPFDWDKIFRNVDDLISGLLFGVEIPDGVDEPWENKAINLMAFLQAAESVLGYNPFSNETITEEDAKQLLEGLYNNGKGLDVFTSGAGQYVADTPPYDNLNVMSDLVLWLMQSGFDAEAIYKLLADLGILDLTELSGGGSSGDPNDITAGISALLPLLGPFAPPGEWLSLLRSLGIWSTWEGYFEMMAIVHISLWFINLDIPIDIAGLLGNNLVNLEKLLACGIMELLPNFGMSFDLPFDFQLSLNENQSYGNPWYYQMGYDSSANLGPWLQGQTGASEDCDNWGWVPLYWDPGGNPVTNPQNPWGHPDKNYTSDKGAAYKKDFITYMVSYLPLAIDLDLPTIELEDIEFDLIPGIASMTLDMMFPLDLSVRLRMEGNPAALVELFEDSGISILGFLTHLYPNANQWIYDAFGALAGGGDGGTEEEEIIDFDQLDLTLLVDTYLSSGIDLYHVIQYLLDPAFLPTSKWYLDSAYMMWDVNASATEVIENPIPYTLYWDYDWVNDPDSVLPYGGYDVTGVPYFGDGDGVPDEYPWYRFVVPSLNQDNPNRGPGTYQQEEIYRNPDMIDEITPLGYPGSGYYQQTPDGIPDGLQHYWFDTPYAYVNTTLKDSDPWPHIDPYEWNDDQSGDYYMWSVNGQTYYWGEAAPVAKGNPQHPYRPEFPYEQVPLIDLPDSLWDNTWAPLYVDGNIAADTSISRMNPTYPPIWACFNYTLDQTDYRFGFWEYNSTDESIDGNGYDYLNCLPFWTWMSLGVSPHIPGAIDTFDVPSMMTDVTQAISANMGQDFWHKKEYNRTYRWFESDWTYWDNFGFDSDENTTDNVNNSNQYWRGMRQMEGATTVFDKLGNLIWTDYGNGTLRIWDPIRYFGDLYEVDLSPFGMLQWIWEGAGDIVKIHKEGSTWKSYTTKYLAPYSIPDIPSTLTWLENKGLSMNNILDMLPSIIEEFSGTGTDTGLESMLSTDMIVGLIQTMDDYFRRVPGTLNMTDWNLYHDHSRDSTYLNITQNRTRSAELILGMISDLPEVMDINPTKVMRGLLSYLMPRLGEIFGSTTLGGSGGGTEDLLNGLTDLLKDSGLVDIMFSDRNAINNIAFNLSIQNTYLNVTLNGWKIINFELDDILLPINATSLGESLSDDSGSSGESSDGSSLPISLPIGFAEPLPYIELSTFNGPYNVTFQAMFDNGMVIPNAEISFAEVQYWEDPTNPDNHSYFFNVTKFNSSRIGWFDSLGQASAPPTAELYITNGSYEMTHTNATGYLDISGNIMADSFGWVDPYIYIHCEPIDSDVFYYWWNVTTNSTQLTLQNNREVREATWAYAYNGEAKDVIVQRATDFNANITNIDDDPWYEIFAKVEIDDSNMDAIQKIFFMANGTIESINVSHGLDYDIRIWDTFEIQNKSWKIEGSGGETTYIFNEVVTPDGSTIVYPTGPKVITGIRVNSDNWIDDTLTTAQIYYYDIDNPNANPTYLLNWDIRKNASWVQQNFTGANRASLLYQYQTDVWSHDEASLGYEWSLTGTIDRGGGALDDWAQDIVNFMLNETTYGGQQYQNLYRILDFDMFFNNFTTKTIKEFQVWYDYYEIPEGEGYGTIGTTRQSEKKWLLAYSYDGKSTYPGTTYLINRERRVGNPTIIGYTNNWVNSSDPSIGYDLIWNRGDKYINGSTMPTTLYHHNTTGAKYAKFVYEINVPTDKFVSQIDWSIINTDDPSANGIKMNISAYYEGDSSGNNAGWKTILNSTWGAQYTGGSNWTDSISSMQNVSGSFYDPIPNNPPFASPKEHWLYLTARGNDASENFTKLRFEIILQDNITETGGFANLGWNDTDPVDLNEPNNAENVSILLEITMYSFLDSWSIDNFELPEGVVSGFHIYAKMWDPQGLQADVFPRSNRVFYPNVTFSYMTVRMENGSNLVPPLGTNLNTLTPKVYVRLEMEDSIVNRDVVGGRGDALFVDANRTYGIIWTPLTTDNMPRVITNTSVINIETDYSIVVNINANKAFRNYYLNLPLNNSRGYIELTRLVTLSNNGEVSSKLGIFPPKSVIDTLNGYPYIYRLGTKIDINPSSSDYYIEYKLNFRPSATFLKDFWVNGSSVVEFLWFSAVWDKPIGTFELNMTYDRTYSVWKSYYFQYYKPTTYGPAGREAYRIIRIQ
ncbi:MAG: hypothetical protein ACTSR3_04750 [Candidatus Helarchaeota archaeon]